MPDRKKLLTIAEAAALLKVSKASLRRWSNSGRLNCYRVGDRGERRFYMEDLLGLVTSVNDNPSLIHPYGQPLETEKQMQPDTMNAFVERRHICFFYKNPREQWQLFRNHFLAHSGAEAKTVYLYHGDKDRVVNWITSEGFDLNDLLANQRLTLLPTSETYCAESCFNIDRMLSFWKKIIVEAENAGIKRLLLTGEMGWANSNIPGHELLVPYEDAFEHMLEPYPWVTVICQYPVYQISGITVYDNLRNHTHIQLPERLAPCFSV